MKIGTVGTNFIVTWFIDAVGMIDGAEIAAVYSRDAATAKEFASKYGVKKTYSDRQAFLDDGTLDFIYVASPNSLHYSWTRDALNAGRNVICEKPFVSREKELAELIGLSREKGLFLFEALTVPHLPNYKLFIERLDEIGTPKLALLNFSQYSSRYDAFLGGKTPNVFNPKFSGGALMDLNYYNLCFILGIYGEPGDVKYYPNLATNGIDTSGALILEYPGFIAVCTACKDSASPNYVQIQGDKGYIRVETTSSAMDTGVIVHTKDGTVRRNEQDKANGLYYEVRDFVEAFRGGDRSVCDGPLDESLLAMRLMEKARKDAGVYFEADKEDHHEN